MGGGGGGPATASSKTSRLISSVLDAGGSLMSIFESGLGGPANTDVYIGKDKQGNIVYVGMSDNYEGRKKQHGKRFASFDKLTTNGKVTRLQARAIETAIMTKHGSTGGTGVHSQFSGENRNRSVGPRRAAFFRAALSWGAQWVSRNHPGLH